MSEYLKCKKSIVFGNGLLFIENDNYIIHEKFDKYYSMLDMSGRRIFFNYYLKTDVEYRYIWYYFYMPDELRLKKLESL